MDTPIIEEYRRCYTCGKWTRSNELINELYCGDGCAEKYAPCSVCGRYRSSSDAPEETTCSIDCSRKYLFVNNRFVVSEETV